MLKKVLFQIIIDQKEFKDYEHRLPLTSITHLSIDGDLYLNHVHWGGKYYVSDFHQGYFHFLFSLNVCSSLYTAFPYKSGASRVIHRESAV